MQHTPDQDPPPTELPPSTIEQASVFIYIMAGLAFADVGMKGLFFPEEFDQLVEKSTNNPFDPGFTIELLRNMGVPDTVTATALLGLAGYFLFYQLERKAATLAYMRSRFFQRVREVFRGKSETS